MNANIIVKRLFLAISIALTATNLLAAELGTLKLGVLKFGTVNWELDVIQRHGLDAEHGFELEIQGFGGGDASGVALMGGAVDGIVEDWLWVSRQRHEGIPIVFLPYSSSVGALMVKAASGIDDLSDLAGKTIGIAGGPLDKSWLLIQAVGQIQGIDLKAESEQAFGAPPLLQEKFIDGELDAVINYWHYAARLEAAGHTRLLGVDGAMEALGVAPETPQLGYIFMEDFARTNPEMLVAFANASRAAKAIMDESDAEWEILRERTRAEDNATLNALKTRYREGIVRHWGDRERDAAAALYQVLRELGGEKLVGRSEVLVEGTFWEGLRY